MIYKKQALIEFVESVIKVRHKINNRRIQNLKNRQMCNAIMLKLQTQISAYKSKWTDEQVKSFMKRNYEDLCFLIPSNKSGDTRKETLNKMIQS